MKLVQTTGIFLICIAALVAAGVLTRGTAPAPASGRVAILAGASGETEEPNFFIEDLRGLQSSLSARGWKVSVVAGSRDGVLPGSLSASNKNLAKGVRETLASAKPGQEALVLFHSHGRERETYWGQRSHSIVSEDRDSSGSDPGFDLDAIEPELLKATARGVRVALVDLSCYSGATQSLHGPACTVSLAASRYVSLCSGRPEERHFNSRFFKLPPAGSPVNLETQFLEARRADQESINLPQISSRPTPALAGWEAFLLRADPLDTFEDLKNIKDGTPPFEPKNLLGEVDRWIAAQPGTAAANPALKSLRAEIALKLARALAVRKQLEGEMRPLAQEYDVPTLNVEIPGRQTMKLGPAYLGEMLQAIQDGKVPEGYTDAQHNLIKVMEPSHAELAIRFAQPLSIYQAKRNQFDDGTEAFARAADSLFESERKLYDLQPDTAGADPCRDFAL